MTISGLARLKSSPTVRVAALLAATLGVGVGIALAVDQHPEAIRNLDYTYAISALVLTVPITLVASTAVLQLSAKMVGGSIPISRALEIAVMGTAANLLPLPGATVTRIAALRATGASYGASIRATLALSALWIAITTSYAGGWIIALGELQVGLLFAIPGAVGALILVLRIGHQSSWRVAATSVWLQVLLVLADVARTYLCLRALGYPATMGESSALAVSAVAGAMVTIVPGGLGINGVAAAGVSLLIGMAPAIGFLASTLNRILALLIVAPVGFVLAIRSARQASGSG